MILYFEDGTSEECSLDDQRQISVAQPIFHPAKRLRRVWDKPPTYARLAVVRCRVIQPDHWVMTDAGMKRVARVER